MSRSKNKIAVTTLLSALACSATASAAGQNGKDIKNVESQTSFSTRKSSESSIKSARSLEGARSWFQKIPTWAKITALVSTPIVTAEIYNEIAGAVSGKKWYSGKYSFVNLARGKGEDENPEPDEDSSTVEDSENQDGTNNNIDDKSEDKTKDKIYTNLGDTNLTTNGKKDTGLGAAPSSLTEEQEEQLGFVLGKFQKAAEKFPGLYAKYEEELKVAFMKIMKGQYKTGNDKHSGETINAIVNFVTGKKEKTTSYAVSEINALKKSFMVIMNTEKNTIIKVFVAINSKSGKLQILSGSNDIILLY